MTKKVAKTTVYWMSEKNEEHLNRLDKAMELVKKVMDDEDIDIHSYCLLQEVLIRLYECEIHFTEEETEEAEEIID